MTSSIANKISTYLLGGMSVEKSSTSVSARSTAFMPLVQSRLSQNMQFTWVTHLFLKFALDVDIVVLVAVEELSRSFCPRTEKCKRINELDIEAAHYPFNRLIIIFDRMLTSQVLTLALTSLRKR